MRWFFIFLCLAMPALASDETPQSGDIPVEEWRSMALGRTLTYMIGGTFFALERYAPDGNKVELQLNTGECLAGTWTHAGSTYCFDWGDERAACFRHVRAGQDILIIQVDNGVETDNIQLMTNISDAPLNCGQNLS